MRETTTHHTRGAGLARGPALIIGTILTAIGLALFLKNGATPTGGFPDGKIDGPTLYGVETNGWTAWFTTAAGALLLLGAAQHLFAKAMSLIVGLALLAAAVLALIDGDVLGLAAANHWTELGWGVAGVLLLLNLFAPRTRRRDRVDDGYVEQREAAPVVRERAVAAEPARRVATGGGTVASEGRFAREEDRTATRVDEPLAAEELNRGDRGAASVRADGRPVNGDDGSGRFARE